MNLAILDRRKCVVIGHPIVENGKLPRKRLSDRRHFCDRCGVPPPVPLDGDLPKPLFSYRDGNKGMGPQAPGDPLFQFIGPHATL